MKSREKRKYPEKSKSLSYFLPLYPEARENVVSSEKRPKESHAGLWYEKFCDCWYRERDNLKIDKNKWIGTDRVGDLEQIREFTNRMSRLIEGQAGYQLHLHTTSRFVTGLGRSNPVENGFAWHPILGTAYLPGSSVKGLVRAWVTEWVKKEQAEKSKDIKRIFGPDTKSPDSQAGSVIFFDALPAGPVQLEPDIMTPHFSEYYKDPRNRNTPPVDWYAPVPIPFLVVGKNQEFIFSIAPRRPENAQDREDAENVINWLQEALMWIGAGAKTAVGYGRFEKVDKR
ncbi:type III-B CRISPR module RAMP protein Cmr6 [Lihuaxuella thermophila]|uniref:CRISPR-associated protein Cmr6 n=1 Tax=Lihuaxuella thermophila TaxID=1173111 RepID=A0A1H8IJS2_9BACL|nr:type III-B CRISPR module RAMP protein Cmr6 [Lihuaxuella thermophila]SEN68913.1 CRISPR-associated protein Cmr6 [Lihuaxuella thermophila]